MSYYEDERQRRRPTREAPRRDDYDEEATYSPRAGNRTTTIVKRRDSYDDVDEEITREFSPPGGGRGYIRETTIRKSGVRPARTRSFEDDRHYDDHYDNRTYAGAARRDDRYRDDKRDRSRRRRYSSGYSDHSRTPPRKEKRKSKVEETLESLGLGGLVAGILGKEAKDRSSSRDRHRSKSRSGRDRAYSETRSDRKRSRSRGGPTREQLTQALKAAVLAGAGEAFRARKEPGGFSGEKGKRILTAAFTAGGVDGLLNTGKNADEHRTRDTIGSVVAGMATSRIVNGPRSQSRGRNGSRSPDSRRGRSESRGGLRNLLAGGAVAAAAKKVYDRSRSRGRSNSPRSPNGSRSPSRSKSRRRSVSRTAARGLAAVGLTSAADKLDPAREREKESERDRDRDRRGSRRRYSDDYDDNRSSYYEESRDVGQPRSDAANGRARSMSSSQADWHVVQPRDFSPHRDILDNGPRHNGDPDTDSDSDLGSSTDEEKEIKKGKRKLLLTTGLASVATIHAGHSVYQSCLKRHTRHVNLREGKITQEQARETRNRDRLQDAASVGLAALGLKGAYSEWKENMDMRSEFSEEQQKIERHRRKREARRRKYEQYMKNGYVENGYSSSMPDLNSPPPSFTVPPGGWHQPFANQYPPQANQGAYPASAYQSNNPHYYDDNPYSGIYTQSTDQLEGGSQLPPPPVGNQHYPDRRDPRTQPPSRGYLG